MVKSEWIARDTPINQQSKGFSTAEETKVHIEQSSTLDLDQTKWKIVSEMEGA